MRKLMLYAATVFVLSTTMLVVMARYKLAACNPLTPDDSVAGISMPQFTLTNQDGAPLTRESLRGRITIVDFMFTHCPFICPRLTAAMGNMAAELKDTPVRFLSVSVDPEHDTPQRLKQYATDRAIDTSRWTLAVGDAATVKHIVANTLKFNLEEEPDNPVSLADGGTMSNISHPGHFVLLGPEAEVLGIYHVDQPDKVAELVKRARAAAAKLR